jgi:hypothetical protein
MALDASQPHRRREVLGVPDPSDPSGVGSRQHRWTTTQMSRQVASAVIGEASTHRSGSEVGVRVGGGTRYKTPRNVGGADLWLPAA